MNKAAISTIIAITTFIFTAAAAAHPLSTQECAEGSDFIKNAALSRENGMDSATFITKILADFAVIKSFPIELRWFVQDLQDEDFLLSAATEVFEHPLDPEVHQRNFLGACLARPSLNQ